VLLARRAGRFAESLSASPRPRATSLAESRRRAADGTAYGTSGALEKEYLRLTVMPSVDSVRPPEVLEQALLMVKRKWLQVGP
jgi:hypothetical protein